MPPPRRPAVLRERPPEPKSDSRGSARPSNGGRIEFTQSAIVLESLVNKFFANFASKGSDADKTTDTEKAP